MGKQHSFSKKNSAKPTHKKLPYKKSKKVEKKAHVRKFNKGQKQENEQRDQNVDSSKLQNAYGLIDKNKLFSMNSDKQLETIKELQSKILTNPEENIKHVESLFLLTKASNLKIVATVLRTLANIFVSVSPLQAINLKGIQERAQTKITKDQFTVIKFQKVLLELYQRYIKTLKDLKIKLKAANFGSDQQMFTEFKKCLLQCALTCFNTLWNFNFTKQLSDLLLHFIKFKECQQAFENLLKDKNIATVKVKVIIINGIAQLIKKKQDNQLPNDLVKILNSTYIDTRHLEKDRDALNFKKKKMKQRLYKQEAYEKKAEKEKGKDDNDKLAKKRQKKQEKMKIKMNIREEVEKQFAQGQAVISNKQVARNNSLILQELFYVYFKILVEKINSKFLKDALAGILSFAHLINVQLIRSMIDHLNTASKIFRQIWKKSLSNDLLQIRLITSFTMESIINGPLSVYNMDDISVTSNLYKILRDINSNVSKVKITKELFRLICITLDECFIKRRQLCQQIVGSFLREVSSMMLREQLPKLYLLEWIRLVASKYSKVSRMFQEDNEGYGIHAYNQICQDPQSTNAINTQILSRLFSLKKFTINSKQFQKQITEYVNRLARQSFQRIEGTQPLQFMLKDDLAIGF